jgi:hypothetical protein
MEQYLLTNKAARRLLYFVLLLKAASLVTFVISVQKR